MPAREVRRGRKAPRHLAKEGGALMPVVFDLGVKMIDAILMRAETLLPLKVITH